MTGRWCLIANVADPKSSKLRRMAKVRLIKAQPGDRPWRLRYAVRGLSISGRTVTAYVSAQQLINLRVGYAHGPPIDGATFDTKAEAEAVVARHARKWTVALTDVLRLAAECGDYVRAGGDCVCSACKRAYAYHPPLAEHDWLTVLCDGRLVKL